jgi:LysR family hydrogen peroxide-inducible transcriptional activator
MHLTLDQLRSLVALAEERSFTLAAKRVYLSQPALSIQIRKLEEALGAKLFDLKKGTLTEAGRVAVAQARRVLEEVETLTLLVRGGGAPFQGPFRLGVIPTLTPYLLPRLLPKLQERYPGLELEIREDLTPNLVQALQEGGLDAGLVGTEENHPGLRTTPLFRETFWAYVAPNHWLYSRESIHPLEIPQEDTWVLSEGHCLRDQVLSVCRPSLTKRRVEFQSGSLETLLLLVEGVGGLTLLPEVALWTLPEAKRAHLRPLTPPGAGRTVYLLLREGSLKTRVAQGVAEEAVRTFQALRLEAQA